MLLQRLFTAPPGQNAGRALYASAARQARRPAFYRAFGVADTVEGRFELYSLHVALLLIRLKGQGQIAAQTAQALFDAYVLSLDDALRDMGVSDVKVGRKMKALGEAFYGRLKAYEDAIEALPRTTELEALLSRTAFEERPDHRAEALSAYVGRAADRLGRQDLQDLLQGRADWPEATMEQAHG
jgi:cytochrome b pre-mRNA-processing protein 3